MTSKARNRSLRREGVSLFERHPPHFSTGVYITGSEIEAAFTEAMFLGFERDREPTNLDIAGVLNEFVPLSKQMAEQITALRQWAKGRARLATSPAAPERRLRKLAA